MPDPLQADVIVPVYRDTGMTVRMSGNVLAHSGPVLRWLIVVDDASPRAGHARGTRSDRESDPQCGSYATRTTSDTSPHATAASVRGAGTRSCSTATLS